MNLEKVIDETIAAINGLIDSGFYPFDDNNEISISEYIWTFDATEDGYL